jgi:hypothetical protein
MYSRVSLALAASSAFRAANNSSIVRSGRVGADAQPMTVVAMDAIIANSSVLIMT